MKYTLSNIVVEAVSVGSVGTCIQLPGMRLAFDMGRCSRQAVNQADTVLITHGHIDHINDVCFHAARRTLQKLTPPTYVIGPEYKEALDDMFAAFHRMDDSKLSHETVVIGPGDEWTLPNGRLVKPFRSPHTRPCQGYCIWDTKSKLKSEYQGLDGKELAALRKTGVSVNEQISFPEVAFTGDTMIDVVEREEMVRKAKLLIMEITFWDDRVTEEQARKNGHIHVDEVIAREDLFENESILITHYSARYSSKELDGMFQAKFANSKLKDRITVLSETIGDWED